MSFENIYVEVDGKRVTPDWVALQERPACDSKAVIVDHATIKISWDPSAEEPAQAPVVEEPSAPVKWGVGSVE